MSTQIVKQKPEGYVSVAHRVPLTAAKNLAESAPKGAVLVNVGGGRYSVYAPQPVITPHYEAAASPEVQSALCRAILGEGQ